MAIKILTIAGLAASILLASCGAQSVAPDGSIITFNPTEAKWNTPGGACVFADYNIHRFQITVRDNKDRPLNNVDLVLTLDLSTNISNLSFMELYDDPNWDGNQSTMPANRVSTPYPTKTDSAGTKVILVRVALDCTFKGNLNAQSGNVMGSASIEVQP